MPRKPAKVCEHPGCGTKTHIGNYCDTHRPKPKSGFNVERKEGYYTFYNSSRWRKLSKAYRRRHPLCVNCKENGKTTEAKHTDHKVSTEEGGALYDWNNLQSLCVSCHSRKTSEEMHSRRR